MTAPYSPEQEERIREALEELCDRIGVEAAAAKLCTTEPALTDLLAARRLPKAILVGLLAKQLGETVDALLDPARPRKRPAPAPLEPSASPPPSSIALTPGVAPIVGLVPGPPPPPGPPSPSPPAQRPPDPSLSGPGFTSTVPEQRPNAAGMPPVPPHTAFSSPAPRLDAAESASADTGEPKLTLLEYASLSMGLELLPHRTADVLAHFGLVDADAQQRESDHWTKFLEAHPTERRAWAPMRERMRMHWLRFDGQIAAAPARPMEHEARTHPSAKTTPEPAPPIALEAYAALCAELQAAPVHAEATFAFYGLIEPQLRDQVNRYWTDRLALYPNERSDWERLYRAKADELATRASHAPVAPVARRYVAAVKSVGVETTAPTMSLAVYALFCVEVEKNPTTREKVYKRHGVEDPAKRRALEEEWRLRFERDPAEHAKWKQLADEIRADWLEF